MDQDRWKTINHIFHAALELSSSERDEFVFTASEGDPELQAEVELLLKADQDAGSYIESPLVPEGLFSHSAPPMNQGDVLCGRFRIVRAIAEGGMGYVFEAFDSELSVRVALKVIRPEIASNPEALARFRQEVRLARQITHPNVCRTFDIERETLPINPGVGKRRDVIFLTMEFLEGETLASRIKRAGRLSLDESLHIARQVADALQAAHSLGIVHRDIKPANIMLVPGENASGYAFRTVITDFGLARLDPLVASGSQSALSHTARPMGTLAYMAPEQLAGSQVSAVTDIYAFGLVLFEAVTGARAFPSDNLLSGITQRLAGPPPAPESIVPDLPTPWRRAIEGCLRSDPADRFQSAADVVAILDGGRFRLRPVRAAAPRHSLFSTWRNWPTSRRVAAFSLIVLATMALLGGVLRYFISRADAKVAPGTLIYLTPVKNETGDKAFDNLTELIQAGLAQSVQVNLLDQGQVGDILEHMTKAPDTPIDAPTAREIAMRAGAVRVVFATVTGSAGDYKLNIDIQQPDNDPRSFRDHWHNTYAWTESGPPSTNGAIPAELLIRIRDASDWIRHEVGESANDIARLDVPPEDVTTSNWQALADYSDADRLALEHPDDAVALLQQAVKADPQFALAYARMGDLLFALNRSEEGYQAYRRALDQDLASRLTRRERDFIKGTFAVDTQDWESAESAFRDCAIYYETDALCIFFRANPLRMMGRSREALDSLKRSLAIAPNFTGAYQSEVYDYILLGGIQDATRAVEKLRQAGGTAQAALLTGDLAFLRNDFAAAQTAFESADAVQVNQDWSMGYALLARLAAERGQYSQAIQYLREGFDTAKSHQDQEGMAARLLDRAYIESRQGKMRECIEDSRAALEIDSSPARVIQVSAALGYLAATMPSSAAMLADELRGLESRIPAAATGVVFDLARYRVHGEWLLAIGQPDAALAEFERADKIDAAITDREYVARALAAFAVKQQNPIAAEALRAKALSAYERIALHPEAVWFCPQWSAPGLFADEIKDALQIADALPPRPEIAELNQRYLMLRLPSDQRASAGR